MNQYLKTIQDLLQQNNLSQKDKEALLSALADADKQWNITEFKLDRTEKVKKTTAILLEETIEELEQKRKAVEEQNRELEIESSLEKVRTVAMGMRKRDDMLDICRTISGQLESLGIKEIRNVQTAIFYNEKEVYINYEYYRRHDKTFITEVDYTTNELSREFAAKMTKGADGFFTRSLAGKQVQDWYKHQKTTNVFLDTYLETAPTLNYYWFSLGPVAIGTSSYTPLTEDELNLFKRFRNVFGLAYQRYIDIEKAEAQAHEARIEASLERMRAVAMSLRKSEDLITVCEAMYKELIVLGFTNIRNAQIAIKHDEKQAYIICEYSDYAVNILQEAPYDSSPIVRELYRELGKTSNALYQKEFSGKEFEDWRRWRKNIKDNIDTRIDTADSMCFYLFSMGTGHVGISTFNTITAGQVEILKRFKNVFELSYRRYSDVAKAEAQAREAQIELALERVRARTMAMHDSKELAESAIVLFQQFQELGLLTNHARPFFSIFDPANETTEIWTTKEDGSLRAASHIVSFNENESLKKVYDAWKAKEPYYIRDLRGKELNDYLTYLMEIPHLREEKILQQLMITPPERIVITDTFFSQGSIAIISFSSSGDEQRAIMRRFAKVFEQTYTRFLDLQRAEAQAREAQIEAALEKVRARTMGMQRSDELSETAVLLFHQLSSLGLDLKGCGFNIWEKNEKTCTAWMSGPDGTLGIPFQLPLTEDPLFIRYYESRQNGEDFWVYETSREEMNARYQYMRTLPVIGELLAKDQEDGIEPPASAIDHVVNFSNGNLIFVTYKPYPEAWDIFKRFGKVFEQTYTRFLDLQKAEAQAREAQIQLALERARAQSMMMQHSKELDDTLRVFHEQVLLLTIPSAFSFLWLPDEDKNRHIFWAAWAESGSTVFKSKAINYPLDRNEPATAQCLVDWKGDQPVVSYHVPPSGVANYFAAWQELIAGVDELTPENFSDGLYYIEAFMKHGCFGVMVKSDMTEDEKKILYRFAVEFERTYTRFLDLQKAEAQTREALIEGALERVRARALAMQQPEELKDVAQVLRNEMGALGVEELETSSIYIHGDSSENVECWYALQDPKATEKKMVADHFLLNLDDTWVGREMKKFYSSDEIQTSIVMQGNNRREWIEYCYKHSPVFSGFYGETIPDRTYHLYKFSHGYIGAAAPGDISAESWRLLNRAASTFSLAYSRFKDLTQARTDLINLKEEKKRAEDALTELQTTQKQLIQSEKMASLGELTAGIAHEIQNPLNFVNNFSDVSNELLEEMKEELASGNMQNALEIADDVKQNLEKILHHGKRADGIVKGMLQHSRTSSGQKELTDINVLADEYLRLAYHGLRAKDKTFNAATKTDFDKNIGKINIIPQEIGRVILNLITNAFYAVSEKKKLQDQGYEPTVSICTKKLDDKIEIRVTDNGTGIPKKIVDKIFQPFFTTKPTGQGTGLGLSLSYDIVKTHAGELKVETKEDRGTEFIIQLPIKTS